MYSPPDRSICPLACFVKFSANSSQSLTSSDETGIDVFYMRLRHFDATAKWTPSIWKARVKTLATIDDMHQWLTEMRAKRESDIIRMSFWPDDLSFMSECCSPKDNPPSKTKTPIPHKAYEYLCALNTTESVSVFFNTFGAGESLRKTERLKKTVAKTFLFCSLRFLSPVHPPNNQMGMCWTIGFRSLLPAQIIYGESIDLSRT